jgi:hypothetical protein
MTNEEFAKLVLNDAGQAPFQPVVMYNPFDDALEVLISNESHRIRKTDDRFIEVYIGRDTGDVTGARISSIRRFIKDMAKDAPDIHFEVHGGKFKVAYLFRAIIEQSKKRKKTFGVLIKSLEETAENYDLEANIGCPASTA